MSNNKNNSVENETENAVVSEEVKNDTKAVKEKKVRIRIPSSSNIDEDKTREANKGKPYNDSVTVQINGKITQIKRGEYVEVPEEIARILEESGYLD